MAKQTDAIRLQKYLAQAGVASRRASEKIIQEGRVKVNGQTVVKMGVKIDPRKDKVSVDGALITRSEKPLVYILLNKPRYVLSTTSDDLVERKTVLDLVDVEERVFPVGRLDFMSEGLILLTNDGAITQKLTHPSFAHEREYEVLLDKKLSRSAMRRWREGDFEIDGKRVGPMQVEPLVSTGPGWLRIILTEGRKRQIREIAEQLDYSVITLIRVRFGPIKLGKLKPGAWRALSPREVDMLWRSVKNSRR
ncbi:MAG TPA: rRNA pseudouridine synthase [Chloroflexi bacterium]|nr:rRNA pseudouridine synthase [Chloroflexota bacterium]